MRNSDTEQIRGSNAIKRLRDREFRLLFHVIIREIFFIQIHLLTKIAIFSKWNFFLLNFPLNFFP